MYGEPARPASVYSREHVTRDDVLTGNTILKTARGGLEEGHHRDQFHVENDEKLSIELPKHGAWPL
jgi:hypothetical protein